MPDEQMARIYVKSNHPDLDLALAQSLTHALGASAQVRIGDPEHGGAANIIVTTDAAASPTDVSKLAGDGRQVVVLAALPSPAAETGYRQAGARAYLPMIVVAAPLAAVVAALVAALTELF